MSTIDKSSQGTPWAWPRGVDARQQWQQWSREAHQWLLDHGCDVRHAVVIVPVGALLPLVRQAWAEAVGGWLPQIDTVAGLMEQHAWRHEPGENSAALPGPRMSLDPVLDRLAVKGALRRVRWLEAWARQSSQALDFAAEHVVQAGHGWWRRLQTCAPGDRTALTQSWLDEFPAPDWTPGEGNSMPGQTERWLLAWSLQWALGAAALGFASDALFSLRPSAWLAVSAGSHVMPGSEGALTQALLHHASQQTEPPAVKWWVAEAVPGLEAHQAFKQACEGLEDEARQATGQVMRKVAEARLQRQAPEHLFMPPVALIALDRSVIRRMRALLDEQGVIVADETGWKLSTTRAAAALTRFVRASQPRASSDDVLDWLKSAWMAGSDDDTRQQALGELERWCRRHAVPRVWSLAEGGEPESKPDSMPEAAWAVLQQAWQQLLPLRALWLGGRANLAGWLKALRTVLEASGAWEALLHDEAGALACESLRLELAGGADREAWGGLSQLTMLDGGGFLRWMQDVMESVVFRPALPAGQVPEVVVTTLARATLRPFSAVVMPGADERQLGAMPANTGWLAQSQRSRLGLSTAADQQTAQWEAFALVMSQHHVVCLHRSEHDGAALTASPWLQRWAQCLGEDWSDALSALQARPVLARPMSVPAPSVSGHEGLLPMRLSATRYEALRQCPYQFFARSVLGLQEHDELEEGMDGADQGELLHAVLQRYHEERDAHLAARTPEQEVAAWMAAAEAVILEQGLHQESMRPYFRPHEQQLPRMAVAYVNWWLTHEREGWSVRQMEFDARASLTLDDGASLLLEGRLDRLDVRHEADQGMRAHVIDYKTGNPDKLSKRLKTPLEDTQLLFYAVLAEASGPLEASYLHLGKDKNHKGEGTSMKATLLPHKDIQAHTEAFLNGVARDWTALRLGHGMSALGEGEACDYCQARGLCRKDDWSRA